MASVLYPFLMPSGSVRCIVIKRQSTFPVEADDVTGAKSTQEPFAERIADDSQDVFVDLRGPQQLPVGV